MVADSAGNEPRGYRCAVIMQHRYEPHRIDAAFVHNQRAQLRVTVLLDHEDEVVVRDKA